MKQVFFITKIKLNQRPPGPDRTTCFVHHSLSVPDTGGSFCVGERGSRGQSNE